MGTVKRGEMNTMKIAAALSYYKYSVNDAPLIEIDPINMILTINGVDLLADRRRALGI